jgi:hypothetical protein
MNSGFRDIRLRQNAPDLSETDTEDNANDGNDGKQRFTACRSNRIEKILLVNPHVFTSKENVDPKSSKQLRDWQACYRVSLQDTPQRCGPFRLYTAELGALELFPAMRTLSPLLVSLFQKESRRMPANPLILEHRL